MDQVTDADGNLYWLLLIPGDGNCLFGALVHQIFGIPPQHSLFASYTRQLRATTVTELRGRPDTYFVHLATFAGDLVREDIPVSSKIDRYLRALETEGFWGGSESIAAICNHYQVAITVHQNNSKIDFKPTTSSEELQWPRYSIFYRGSQGGPRIHYDSVICLRTLHRFDYSSVDPDDVKVTLFGRTMQARVKQVGAESDSLFVALHRQLTGLIPTSEEINIYRCLVASQIEVEPPSFMSSCGFLFENDQDLSHFTFRLRIGHHDGGLATLVLMSSLLRITIFVHSTVQSTRRFDPTGHTGVVSIHMVEDVRGTSVFYASVSSLEQCQDVTQLCGMLSLNPMHLAEKVVRKEHTSSQETIHPNVPIHPNLGLHIASLNVNGCRTAKKRDSIDACLLAHCVHIALLQEVNLDCLQTATPNYRWYMGGVNANKKRGLALLIRHGTNIQIRSIKDYGHYIQFTEVVYKAGPATRYLCILNVHGPNQCADRFFGDLGEFIGRLPDTRRLLVVGDFNSHLCYRNLSTLESTLIGRYAGHDNFNGNGLQMRLFINLYSLAVRSTQHNSNASFKVTWSNGTHSSQVDHILTSLNSGLYLKRLQCTKPEGVTTDHRVMLFNIVDNRSVDPSPSLNKNFGRSAHRIDPTPLKHDIMQAKFKKELDKHTLSVVPGSSVDTCWTNLREKLHVSASKVLKQPTPLMLTKDCRLALAKVKKLAFWVNRSHHPKWAHKLTEAKEELKKKIRESEEKEIEDFFKGLHRFTAGERINRTYRYLKRFKNKSKNRKSARHAHTTIRLRDWLVDSDVPSTVPSLIPEQPSEGLLVAPTLGEIKAIINRMKNGKTPGVDGLCSEFFKYSNEQTLRELHQLLVKVWTENQLPEEWRNIVVVPIPKTRYPKSVDEYRRICLSCTGYKVYATWILNKLQELIGPIGLHQAAFLPDRSTTEHLHFIQRVLQEKWNEGTPLVLMSLDIEKAFDKVSLEPLSAILREQHNRKS